MGAPPIKPLLTVGHQSRQSSLTSDRSRRPAHTASPFDVSDRNATAVDDETRFVVGVAVVLRFENICCYVSNT